MSYYLCEHCGQISRDYEMSSKTIRERHIDHYVEEQDVPARPICGSILVEPIPREYYDAYDIDDDSDGEEDEDDDWD